MNAALADFIFGHAVFALKPRCGLGRIRDDAGRIAEDKSEARLADEANAFSAKLIAQIVDAGDEGRESAREGSESAGEAVGFLALGDDGVIGSVFFSETADGGGVRGGFAVAGPKLDDFVERRKHGASALAGKNVEVESVDGTRFGNGSGVVGLGKDGEVDSFCGDGLGELAEKTGRVAVASAFFPKPA